LIEHLLEEQIGETMKRIILALALATFSHLSNASFDYVCLEDCSNEGKSFQFCTTKCAINDFPVNPQLVQSQRSAVLPVVADAICLKECSGKGYAEQLCQKLCTSELNKLAPQQK
jgi:hypothetical protein